MKQTGLRFGPLGNRTMHLCVDMQNIFAEQTSWHTSWMERVLPVVTEIVGRHPSQTVFSRFIPPLDASDRNGSWRRYFERWPEMTRRNVDPRLLQLVEPLASFAPPATIIDKPHFSPFHETALASFLCERRCDSVVVSGAETDMCVLAAVLDATDLGLRVILPVDAVCSSSDSMHDALLALYGNRFSMQIEIAETTEVLADWRC